LRIVLPSSGKLKLIELYRFATTRAENQRPEPICYLIAPLWHKVPVDVIVTLMDECPMSA
jgi:hypothetical protein